MFEREDLTKIIVKYSLAIYICSMGIVFFLAKDYKPYLTGLTFGTIISILSFKLMEVTGKKAILKDPQGAYKYTLLNYFLRMVIYFVILLVAAIADYINFPMTVLGLLNVRLVITILTLVDKHKSDRGKESL